MSKYRELADRLERLVIMDEVGSNNPLAREAATALRELEAERDRLREAHEKIRAAADKAKADTTGECGAYGDGFHDGIAACGDISRAVLEGKR